MFIRPGIVYNDQHASAEQCVEGIMNRYDRGHQWRTSAMRFARERAEQFEDCDLMVVVGGDGTLLRAVKQFGWLRIPFLGINSGNLGFLAELSLKNAVESLGDYLTGENHVEERSMLSVSLGNEGQHYALNECWIHRGVSPKVIGITAEIDGVKFNTYRGDGVLVSTPTGATGYAYALGAPLMDITDNNYLLAPIADNRKDAHHVVVGNRSEVVLDLSECDDEAPIYVDGIKIKNLVAGSKVAVRNAPDRTASFLRKRSGRHRWSMLAKRLVHAD